MVATVRTQALVVLGALALLEAELFLTADADQPNTMSGLIIDMVLLLVLGAVSVALVGWGARQEPGGRRRATIICLVLAVLTLVVFWTVAPVVFGVAAYLLAAPEAKVVRGAGLFVAAAVAAFMVLEIVRGFAPGIPA
jgi:hypothetical protein